MRLGQQLHTRRANFTTTKKHIAFYPNSSALGVEIHHIAFKLAETASKWLENYKVLTEAMGNLATETFPTQLASEISQIYKKLSDLTQ